MNKQCDCYLWHECISKRESSKIASCLYNYLEDLDKIMLKRCFCSLMDAVDRIRTLPLLVCYYM
ncbi:hypothetical protein J6590_079210 [Homalodisca vitripennis]|nr:hypothetical protein J6590_079210 [Homalodisca vitripennis]